MLLTPEERAALPPPKAEHTHRWTVALRSAASPPPPAANPNNESQSQQPARFGGADDYSYFIKKVQFKLHETIPNSLRTLDKPPWEVTETGWGEFDLSIKVFFSNETYEKPIVFYHHLKLHPWAPSLMASNLEEPPAIPVQEPQPTPSTLEKTADATPASQSTAQTPATDAQGDTTMEDARVKDEVASPGVLPLASAEVTQPPPTPLPQNVSPVYSWQYDEIVFTEPAESLFRLLTQHPPTPLPAKSRFDTATASHPSGNLHEFSLEVQEKEGKRLEKARREVLTDLEAWRNRLVKAQQKKESLAKEAAEAKKEDSVQP